MTGLIGGTVDDAELEAMASALYQEDWYETVRATDRGGSVGLVGHGSRDAHANVIWRGDGAIGVLHGVVSNRDRLSLSWDELFEALRERPDETLRRLEGPFALACVDVERGRIHLGTDKAGSRPIYYAADRGFQFASELTPLLEHVSDPELDERGVSDLLLLGYVAGDRTLVDGISNVPPATRVTFADGQVDAQRYWYPDEAGLAPEGYPSRWLDTYRVSMGDVASTAGDLSLWLSGGLDSRIAAGVLADLDCPFGTLTYETHKGRDAEPAREVADYLGVPHREVGRDTDLHVVDAIKRAVATTDAMLQWGAYACLPFVMGELHDTADVVMEGGNFLGEDMWAAHLERSDSAAEAIYKRKTALPAERVRELMDVPVDPMRSIHQEVAASVDGPTDRTALDAVRRLYAYSHMRSNIVQRSQIGTRVVAHGSVLDTVIRMPARYRMQTLPLTNGKIPEGVPPIKREVVSRLDSELAEIPYDRTGFAPARPRPMHTVGFGVREAISKLREDVRTTAAQYHEDDRLQSFIDSLMLDARDREVLDADAVAAVHEQFADGDPSNFSTVAAITGLELWSQRFLDATTETAVARM